ncbi:MAG: hypothetical protein GY861_16910 [bacterium]|nr:hypothetical protein [bacterium]
MIQSYSQDCDYLRKKFNLPETVNLYELVRVTTAHIQQIDAEAELKELNKISEKPKPISKEKKRGRPRKKRPSSN